MAMVVGFHAPVRKSELCLKRRYMVRTNVIVFSTASIGPNVSPKVIVGGGDVPDPAPLGVGHHERVHHGTAGSADWVKRPKDGSESRCRKKLGVLEKGPKNKPVDRRQCSRTNLTIDLFRTLTQQNFEDSTLPLEILMLANLVTYLQEEKKNQGRTYSALEWIVILREY